MSRFNRRRKRLGNAVARCEQLEGRLLFAFGFTSSGGQYVVNDGANLSFSISQSDGDLTSIVYKGNQLEAPYSATQRYSHYESGLGTSTVTATETGSVIIIAATSSSLPITQYYMCESGSDNIYMATYCSSSTAPTPGEMRFITYLSSAELPNVNGPSDVKLGNETIESTDIFENSANGQTYSKYYSGSLVDTNSTNGVTGNGIGAWMVVDSYEKSSGGPFFKDIEQQTTSMSDELYWYMFSGHAQTEAFRGPGLFGPYALVFNGGGAPTTPSFSFMNTLGLKGWVTTAGRGTVAGDAIGLPSGDTATVALSNATAQYWTAPSTGEGYDIGGVIPGTYTETFYADQLAVGTQQVTITAGQITNTNIHDTYVFPTNTIWTIGALDGTPSGFLNASLLPTMHPSDSRMSSWGPVTYTVGKSSTSAFPAVEFQEANQPTTIDFSLTAAQVEALTMHINITDNYANGRPYIVVNAGKSNAWTSPTPGIPAGMPAGRTITLGSYRGTNTQEPYSIPASALASGSNTITIYVASGSGSLSEWLSPAIVFDELDLEPTTGSDAVAGAMAAAAIPAEPASSGGAPASSSPFSSSSLISDTSDPLDTESAGVLASS